MNTPAEFNPFPGLRPYRSDEAHIFFGREEQCKRLLQRLTATRVVAVVGTSGSGKSSLVRAGLLPALLAGYLPGAIPAWRILDIKPGTDPIGRLSRELAAQRLAQSTDPEELRTNSQAILEVMRHCVGDSENLLILVDQFEELFRFKTHQNPVEDRDEKAAFVRLLIETARQTDVTQVNNAKRLPIYVVLTLRSEYLGKCAEFRDLPEEVDNAQFLVPRMNREQRRLAIEGPIRVAGASITPQLVQQLLNDTGDDPDQLPVLQHALMRTWNRWRNRLDRAPAIQLSDYEDVGGIRRAIDQHADEAWEDAQKALPSSGDRIVRCMFQCLRQRDADGGESRRLANISQVQTIAECTPEELNAALECFQREGRTFIVRSGDELDITHEALLRKWGRIRDWADQEEDDRVRYERLLDYARGGARLTGRALMELSSWWGERNPTEVWAARYDPDFGTAREYLERSAEEERTEREKEKAQQQAEANAKRYRWIAVISGMTILLLLAGTFYVTSLISTQRDRAVAQMLASKAAVTGIEARTEAAVLLAAESFKRIPHLDTQFLLSRFIGLVPERLSTPKDLRSRRITMTSDGMLLIVATQTGLEVHNLVSGTKLRSAPVAGVTALALDNKGSTLAIATEDGEVAVWTVDPLERAAQLHRCEDAVTELAVSRDGRTVAAVCDKMYVWKSGRGWRRLTQPLQGAQDVYAGAIALNENGSRLAVVTDSELKVYELPSFKAMKASRQINEDVNALHVRSLEADELSVVGATLTGVRSWRVEGTDTRADKFLQHPRQVLSLTVSSDGKYVLTGSEDGFARLWSLEEEREVSRMFLGGPVQSVALAMEAGLMAAGGSGENPSDSEEASGMRALVWRRPGLRVAVGRDETLPSTVSGRYLLYNSIKGLWSVWDLEREEKVLEERRPDDFRLIRLYGSWAIGVSGNRRYSDPYSLTLKKFHNNKLQESLWTVTVPSRRADRKIPVELVLSDDGNYLAVQWIPDHVSVVEGRTGRVMKEFSGHQFLTFVPDTSSVMMRKDSAVVLGSLADSSEPVLPLPEAMGLSKAVFSLSGKLLAGAGRTGIENLVSKRPERSTPTLFVWKWPERELLANIPVGSEIVSIRFDDDSRHLMLLEQNGTIHIWGLGDPAPVEELARLTHGSGTYAVAFLPSGRIGIINNDGYNKLKWDDLASEACRRIKQNLTRTEWANLVPDESYPKQKTCPDRP